jgi:hypothetical protein
MTRHNKDERKKLLARSASVRDLGNLLDILLALDRSVVELSMHVYNVSPGHQLAMREQNRCLHDAVRKRLPRSMSKHASVGKA